MNRRGIPPSLGACAICFVLTACDVPQQAQADLGVQSSPGIGEPAEPQVLSRQELAQLAFPSVVMLVFSDAQGRPTSQGSGFYVADGVIATNYHVIQGSARGMARVVGRSEQMVIDQIVAVDPARDLALLGTRETGPHLEITQRSLPGVGATIFAVGNPRGLEGTFSDGIVSAIRPVGSDTIIQVTAAISPGSSGGPILDETGRVVGVATATFRGGQNLNFAMPAHYLRELMESPDPRPLTIQSTPSRRSILSELGEAPSTGVIGGQLEWSGAYDWDGNYTLSLKNNTEYLIRDIAVFVIFHDRSGNPIETDAIIFRDLVPPGLARRATGSVHPSIKRLTTNMQNMIEYNRTPATRVDIRVLNYDIVN